MAPTTQIPVKTAAGAKQRDESKGNANEKGPEPRVEAFSEPALEMPREATRMTHEDVATRAYYCWQERGCPDGSPDVDWRRAEEELQAGKEPG
jgi:hypothetical protein